MAHRWARGTLLSHRCPVARWLFSVAFIIIIIIIFLVPLLVSRSGRARGEEQGERQRGEERKQGEGLTSAAALPVLVDLFPPLSFIWLYESKDKDRKKRRRARGKGRPLQVVRKTRPPCLWAQKGQGEEGL